MSLNHGNGDLVWFSLGDTVGVDKLKLLKLCAPLYVCIFMKKPSIFLQTSEGGVLRFES